MGDYPELKTFVQGLAKRRTGRGADALTRTRFDVFMSHNHGTDGLGRDTHERVGEIGKELSRRGFDIWFDNEQLSGDLK